MYPQSGNWMLLRRYQLKKKLLAGESFFWLKRVKCSKAVHFFTLTALYTWVRSNQSPIINNWKMSLTLSAVVIKSMDFKLLQDFTNNSQNRNRLNIYKILKHQKCVKRHWTIKSLLTYLMNWSYIWIFYRYSCHIFIKKKSKYFFITMTSRIAFNMNLFMVFTSWNDLYSKHLNDS